MATTTDFTLSPRIENIKIRKFKKKTFAEKFYHRIPIDDLSPILYPGRRSWIVSGDKECGTFKSAYSCENGCTIKVFSHCCTNINCPTCYLASIKKSSMRVAERFEKILKLLKKLNLTKTGIRHISFNVMPRKINVYRDLMLERKSLTLIIKKYVGSGILVFHPRRFEKDAAGEKVFPLNLVYSPHFHFIGHIYLPKGDIFEKKHGFNYSAISRLYNRKSVYNCVKYLLTHAGYFKNRHILTWINHYSYNKLVKINVHKHKTPIQCIMCGERVYRVDVLNDRYHDVSDYGRFYLVVWSCRLHLGDQYLKETVVQYDFLYKNRKKMH